MSVIDQLSEYSVAGQQIGHGRRVGRAVVAAPQPGAVVTDAEIQDMLRQHLGTDPAFPAVGPNSLYFVYLPPGTAVAAGGTRSCQGFCGYHDVLRPRRLLRRAALSRLPGLHRHAEPSSTP